MKLKLWILSGISGLLVACQTPLSSVPPQANSPLATSLRQMSQSTDSMPVSGRIRPSLDEELQQLSQIVRRKTFAALDHDRDQRLSREEFGPPGLEDYDQRFQSIDRNQDYFLDLDEVLKGPALNYTMDVSSMKKFLEQASVQFGDSFDQNKDHKLTLTEIEEIAQQQGVSPVLQAFLVAEFHYRDLNQDQVLEGQEANLLYFMFYYKLNMPDTLLPSEQYRA